jgi:hypothetical protein
MLGPSRSIHPEGAAFGFFVWAAHLFAMYVTIAIGHFASNFGVQSA